ncbi:MAG: ABC transporter permease [Armatimonadota bacterium]
MKHEAALAEAAPRAGPARVLSPVSNARRALRRFVRHRRALFGFVTLFVLVVLTFPAPLFMEIDPNAIDFASRLSPPGWTHPFGTDNLGRDYFARCLYGGRISLGVGFVAMTIAVLLGTTIGSIAGYFGGTVDNLLMRGVDLIISLPIFFMILIAQMVLRPNIINVMLIIGLTSWMGVSRIVRGEVLAQRSRDYVTAALAMGNSSTRIILRHVLPNVVGPITVVATLNVASAILVESALSFLGLGVQPPQASWGSMVSGAQTRMFLAPWVAIFPGVMLSLTVVSFNFIGDGLRDALDPRSDRRI